MATLEEILEKVKRKYPLPTKDNGWKELKQNDEFFEALMQAVAGGQSVSSFARQIGLKTTLVNSWLSTLKDEDKLEQYRQARAARANYFADRMLDICEQVEAGILDAPQGRVIVDSLRWLAARLDPHLWGDRLQVQANVKSSAELHLAAVQEMALRQKAGDERPVIEGEVVPDSRLLE